MFCSKCGKEIEKDMQFCNNCGNKVDISSSTKKSNSSVKKIVKIELIVFLLFILFIAVMIAFSSSANRKNISKENLSSNSSIETEEKQSTSNILTLDDVKLDTYTSINQMNEATKRVASVGWEYITERPYQAYPNAKWVSIRILRTDNYGRFVIDYSYLTSQYSSDATRTETIYIWVKDINSNNMGYYYSRPSDWGKPLT
jgi:hypothetical protein